MSLTPEDLQAISTIVDKVVSRRIKPLENDIKEIYSILVRHNIQVV